MQILQKLNINVQPMTSHDIPKSIQLIVDSYQAQCSILQKKIMPVIQFRTKTLQMLSLFFQAERKINQQRNTSIFYSSKYLLNGRIVGLHLVCDLVQFVQILNKTNDIESYYEPIKKLGSNIKVGSELFAGRVAVSKDMMKLGLFKSIALERLAYFFSQGYKRFYSVMAHKTVQNFLISLGANVIYKVQMKNEKGQIQIFKIAATDIGMAFAIYNGKAKL